MIFGTVAVFLVVLGLAALGRADYIIDDANATSLEYTITAPGLNWEAFGSEATVTTTPSGNSSTLYLTAGPVLGAGADSFLVPSVSWFDGTFTYGLCHTTDGCAISIPFTGSGATLYVLQAGPQGVNVSITVDGGPATFHALAPPPPPNYYQSNVSIFDVQSLPFGQHTVALAVYDYGSDASNMMFDYAAINDTPAVAPVASTIFATSSSGAPPLSGASSELSVLSTPTITTRAATASASTQSGDDFSSSHDHVGAMVAGACACVLTMALLLAICIWRRRRSRPGHASRFHASAFHDSADAEAGNSFPKSPPSFARSISGPIPILSAGYRHVRSDSPPVAREVILAATISPFPHGRMPAHPMARPTRHATSGSIGLASGGPPLVFKSRLDTALGGAPRPPSSSAGRASAAVHMTDAQIEFVANLHKNDVPGETVAKAIDEMLASELPMSAGQGELFDGLPSLEGCAPPSYESHAL